MGRSLLPSPPEAYPHLHNILSLSFIALSIAASVAILATLCASCHRKSEKQEDAKAEPTSPQTNGSVHKKNEEPPATDATTMEVSDDDQIKKQPSVAAADEDEKVVLDVNLHGPILPTVTHSESTSKRKLSMSLSMKLPEGLSRIRTGKKDKSSESEDTLWKKTIIMGEKCRLPSGEEEEAAADGGQKSYHPRTPRSLPASRNNSFFNPDAVVSAAAPSPAAS